MEEILLRDRKYLCGSYTPKDSCREFSQSYKQVPMLFTLMRASLATGYIPLAWRRARVTILKPSKEGFQPKAFRLIALSSFILKTMEKLDDPHVRDNLSILRPLNKNQHAYQTGKLCETDLHKLVTKIEYALENQEIPLAMFLDIEETFNKISFDYCIFFI